MTPPAVAIARIALSDSARGEPLSDRQLWWEAIGGADEASRISANAGSSPVRCAVSMTKPRREASAISLRPDELSLGELLRSLPASKAGFGRAPSGWIERTPSRNKMCSAAIGSSNGVSKHGRPPPHRGGRSAAPTRVGRRPRPSERPEAAARPPPGRARTGTTRRASPTKTIRERAAETLAGRRRSTRRLLRDRSRAGPGSHRRAGRVVSLHPKRHATSADGCGHRCTCPAPSSVRCASKFAAGVANRVSAAAVGPRFGRACRRIGSRSCAASPVGTGRPTPDPTCLCCRHGWLRAALLAPRCGGSRARRGPGTTSLGDERANLLRRGRRPILPVGCPRAIDQVGDTFRIDRSIVAADGERAFGLRNGSSSRRTRIVRVGTPPRTTPRLRISLWARTGPRRWTGRPIPGAAVVAGEPGTPR